MLQTAKGTWNSSAITQWNNSWFVCMTNTYREFCSILRLSQDTGIPMERDTATAKARINKMGVAISSAIVPRPILQCKEHTHCMFDLPSSCTQHQPPQTATKTCLWDIAPRYTSGVALSRKNDLSCARPLSALHSQLNFACTAPKRHTATIYCIAKSITHQNTPHCTLAMLQPSTTSLTWD